jgi:hypothetical protein
VVWLGNCSSHSLTPRLTTILTGKNTILRYLLPCSTHLCQPADTFIISKIKDAWTKRWKAKKIELIQTNAWQNTARANGQWSGKLTNPGKRFFLQLAADSVEDVNKEIDYNNMSYAMKAMIRCGMALTNTFKGKMYPTMLGQDKCVFSVFRISYKYKISICMYFLYSMDNFLCIPEWPIRDLVT